MLFCIEPYWLATVSILFLPLHPPTIFKDTPAWWAIKTTLLIHLKHPHLVTSLLILLFLLLCLLFCFSWCPAIPIILLIHWFINVESSYYANERGEKHLGYSNSTKHFKNWKTPGIQIFCSHDTGTKVKSSNLKKINKAGNWLYYFELNCRLLAIDKIQAFIRVGDVLAL